MEAARRREGRVAAVGQRCDDEPARVADVLVAKLVARVCLAHHAPLGARLPVETELQQPLKVVDRGAARLDHLVEDLA